MPKLRTACCAFTYPRPRPRSQNRWRSRFIELGTACIRCADIDPRSPSATGDADGGGVLDRERVALELLTHLEYLLLYRNVDESPRVGFHACGRRGWGPQRCEKYSLEGGWTFEACSAAPKPVYGAAGRHDLILHYVHLILFHPGDGDGPAFSGGNRDRRRLFRRPLLAGTQCPGAFSHPAFGVCQPHRPAAGGRRCSLSPRCGDWNRTQAFLSGHARSHLVVGGGVARGRFLACVRRAGSTAARIETGSGP